MNVFQRVQFLGILKTCDLLPSNFNNLQIPTLVLAPRGFGGIDAQLLQQAYLGGSGIPGYGLWNWAVCQWFVYHGPYIGIGIALAVLAVWQEIRLRHACHKIKDVGCDAAVSDVPAGETPALQTAHGRWATRLAGIGCALLVAAIPWVLVYLWIMPSVIQAGESDYEYRMAYLEKPRDYSDAVDKIMAEIREQSWRKAIGTDVPPGGSKTEETKTPQG